MQTPSPYKSFSARLCEEFLEEATFLLEQLSARRNDPELRWLDAEEDEARLEAHLDGLVVCADAAVEVCVTHLHADDPAELQAALRALCRLGCRLEVLNATESLDPGDPQKLAAAAAALSAEAPKAWHDDLAEIALRHPPLAAAVAPALARDGRAAEPRLLALLAAADETSAPPVLEALGRVGGNASVDAVTAHVASESPATATAAAVAAWRLGADIERPLLRAVGTRPWLIVPAALGCGRAAVAAVTERLADDDARGEALLALGLLGDLSSVRALYQALSDATHAQTAALALSIVTGAPLLAETFVPDPVDPDALFDDERAHWEQTGEAPLRSDGTPFGTTEIRLSTDPGAWRAWLSAHKSRFDPSRRYRYGLPYSPASLLRTVEAERVPPRVRAFACDELKTRYGCGFPLSVEMPVTEQRRLIARLHEWVDEKGRAFEPGEWYRSARRLS